MRQYGLQYFRGKLLIGGQAAFGQRDGPAQDQAVTREEAINVLLERESPRQGSGLDQAR